MRSRAQAAAAYFYFGHHKCATRFVIKVCQSVSNLLSLSNTEFHNDRMFNNNLNEYVKSRPVDFVYYTNADFHQVAPLDLRYRGFHVIRDPRDIVVSGYFSHLNSHPTNEWNDLIEHRNVLSRLNLADGLSAEIEYAHRWIDAISTWDYTRENILEIKFEELTVRAQDVFVQIFTFLNLIDDTPACAGSSLGGSARHLVRLLSDRVSRAPRLITEKDLVYQVYLMQFHKLAGSRSKGQEDQKSHYRKGIAGDWKNHFTDSHKVQFKDRYPGLLERLGYESTSDW